MAATPFEILSFAGRGVSARDYHRLKAALDRLQSTTVATSIRQPSERRRHRFSWINEWKERSDVHGRPEGLELILPDWFFSAVLDDALVLSIDRTYFDLTGGLERWLYRLMRKHAGYHARRSPRRSAIDLPYVRPSGEERKPAAVRRPGRRQDLPGGRHRPALVENGWRVLFTRTTDLVQKLQAARRDLALESAIAKLDKYHLLILDDLAYASKDQAETSVLFELISARYERRSLLITANQPFADLGGSSPTRL